MVINVRSVSKYADTNAQGDLLFDAVSQALRHCDLVMIDFTGVSNVTSSFVNSSFVRLLGLYDFKTIQSRVQVMGANKQIASMIRARMYYEAA